MASTIHFIGGEVVTVQSNADEVLEQLYDPASRFTRFVMIGGLEIHVASDQVAYVAEVPEPGVASTG